jgi:heme exporter protein D
MHWNSLSEFLAMGGYAGYVWGSFGVVALIMVLEPLLARRHQKKTFTRLKRQLRAEARNTTGNSA